MSTENLARLKRLVLEGFGTGNFSVLDELVAENVVEHQSGVAQGREGLKTLIRNIRSAFPDLTYRVVQMVEDGDKVWGHFRGRGTNHGGFMGHEPTGKTADIEVIAIARFEKGKIVEQWGVPDRLEVLMQLGLVPASEIKQLYA